MRSQELTNRHCVCLWNLFVFLFDTLTGKRATYSSTNWSFGRFAPEHVARFYICVMYLHGVPIDVLLHTVFLRGIWTCRALLYFHCLVRWNAIRYSTAHCLPWRSKHVARFYICVMYLHGVPIDVLLHTVFLPGISTCHALLYFHYLVRWNTIRFSTAHCIPWAV